MKVSSGTGLLAVGAVAALIGFAASCGRENVIKPPSLASTASASASASAPVAEASTCAVPTPSWYPATPEVDFLQQPAPHPEPDCPFYQLAWHTFLSVTKPTTHGEPAFLEFPTLSDIFGKNGAREFAKGVHGGLNLAVRDGKGPNDALPLGAGVQQAGLHDVLVDQEGHPIYYSIQVNKAFLNFATDSKHPLNTIQGIKAADPELRFEPGLIELKSAWQVVNQKMDPRDYFVTRASVPTVDVINGKVIADTKNPREVTVALLALHVVFTIKGHPEFIWSTFEHVGQAQESDIAPTALKQPKDTDLNAPVGTSDLSLYRSGTSALHGNHALQNPGFNKTTQTFVGTDGAPLQTSIYRMFHASKSNTVDLDQDLTDLNDAMTALFSSTPPSSFDDKRSHYRLVGAIWLDHPEQSLQVNKRLTNDEHDPDIVEKGTDSPHSILAGEDRLSSTSMESFTQPDFLSPHCFSCHDTRAVRRDKSSLVLVEPKALNVSHVFSRFIDENSPQVP